MQAWRKIYTAIKDSAQIGRANIISEFKDIDVAILKATRHAGLLPKEKNIRKLLSATSSVRHPSDVAYCVHKLGRRLAKTRSWTVALKILIIIHRTLRNGDKTFREELINYSHQRHIFHCFNLPDSSCTLARECSSWVRAYALFLEERLNCFSTMKFDIESEELINSSSGTGKAHSRMRIMPCDELLKKLPSLQQLLFCLIGCQPEIAGYSNQLIQYALALLMKESFKIYCAISDGIINLVDLFFGMSRNDAIKALSIYKKSCHQAESLSRFYEFSKTLENCRHFQFPDLKQPPPSFLKIMEEYISEVPPELSVSERKLECGYKSKIHSQKLEEAATNDLETEAKTDAMSGDLLGLCNLKSFPAQQKSGAFHSPTSTLPEGDTKFNPVAGWELALFSASSPIGTNLSTSKLGGGFDWILLDSPFDTAAPPPSNPFIVALPAHPTPSLL